MTKEELIQMLEEKRKIVAPVDVAYQNFIEASAKYQKFAKFFKYKDMIASHKTLVTIGKYVIGAWFLLQLLILVFRGAALQLVGSIATIYYLYYRHSKTILQIKEKYEAAKALYEEEASNPDYIAAKKGFPEQFYNYTALYRLGKLLEEGRADDLKEAFNLLENQQYNETQIGMQEEMRTLQKDTANSARIAAIASTVAAFNSFSRR